jgi:hypothetical protein
VAAFSRFPSVVGGKDGGDEGATSSEGVERRV